MVISCVTMDTDAWKMPSFVIAYRCVMMSQTRRGAVSDINMIFGDIMVAPPFYNTLYGINYMVFFKRFFLQIFSRALLFRL